MIDRRTGKLYQPLRITALAVALIFTWNTVAWADGSGNIFVSLQQAGSKKISSDSQEKILSEIDPISNIQLSKELGQIKRVFRGSRPGLVVHIQDAHVNEEAQRRIADIIDYFAAHHKAQLVSVEGAAGEIAHQLLSAYPDEKARALVADYFLKEALLTGPEYLTLSKRPEIILYGVEEKALYDENRKVFLEALDFKSQDEAVLRRLRTGMEKIARHVLSEPLWELIRRKHAFQEEDRELVTYIRYLLALSGNSFDPQAHPQIQAFTRLLEFDQQIDFEKAQEEVEIFIKNLQTKLSGELLRSFVERTEAFRSHELPRIEYYQYLSTLLPKIEMAPSSLSHLRKYFEYLQLQQTLGIGIFEEIHRLETEMKEKLFRNQEERTLEHLFRILEIYEKIFDFSLTQENAKFFFEHRAKFRSETFRSFLFPLFERYHFDPQIKNLSLQVLDEDLPKIERFYELALERDSVLIERSIGKMEELHEPISLIVTGGFHTPGIERALQARGYSYLVVAPRIAKATDEDKEKDRYRRAMKAEPTRLAQLLTEAYFPARSRLANDPRYQLNPETNWPSVDILLKKNPRHFDPVEAVKEDDFAAVIAQKSLMETLTLHRDGRLPSDLVPQMASGIRAEIRSDLLPWLEVLYGEDAQKAEVYPHKKSMMALVPAGGMWIGVSMGPEKARPEISLSWKNEARFKFGGYEIVMRPISPEDKADLSLFRAKAHVPAPLKIEVKWNRARIEQLIRSAEQMRMGSDQFSLRPADLRFGKEDFKNFLNLKNDVKSLLRDFGSLRQMNRMRRSEVRSDHPELLKGIEDVLKEVGGRMKQTEAALRISYSMALMRTKIEHDFSVILSEAEVLQKNPEVFTSDPDAWPKFSDRAERVVQSMNDQLVGLQQDLEQNGKVLTPDLVLEMKKSFQALLDAAQNKREQLVEIIQEIGSEREAALKEMLPKLAPAPAQTPVPAVSPETVPPTPLTQASTVRSVLSHIGGSVAVALLAVAALPLAGAVLAFPPAVMTGTLWLAGTGIVAILGYTGLFVYREVRTTPLQRVERILKQTDRSLAQVVKREEDFDKRVQVAQEELNVANQAAQEKLETLQRQIDSRQGALQAIEGVLSTSQMTSEGLKNDIAAQRDLLTQLQEDHRILLTQSQTLKSQLDMDNQRLENLKKELARTQQETSTAQTELASVASELGREKVNFTQSQQTLREVTDKIWEAEARLKGLQGQIQGFEAKAQEASALGSRIDAIEPALQILEKIIAENKKHIDKFHAPSLIQEFENKKNQILEIVRADRTQILEPENLELLIEAINLGNQIIGGGVQPGPRGEVRSSDEVQKLVERKLAEKEAVQKSLRQLEELFVEAVKEKWNGKTEEIRKWALAAELLPGFDFRNEFENAKLEILQRLDPIKALPMAGKAAREIERLAPDALQKIEASFEIWNFQNTLSAQLAALRTLFKEVIEGKSSEELAREFQNAKDLLETETARIHILAGFDQSAQAFLNQVLQASQSDISSIEKLNQLAPFYHSLLEISSGRITRKHFEESSRIRTEVNQLLSQFAATGPYAEILSHFNQKFGEVFGKIQSAYQAREARRLISELHKTLTSELKAVNSRIKQMKGASDYADFEADLARIDQIREETSRLINEHLGTDGRTRELLKKVLNKSMERELVLRSRYREGVTRFEKEALIERLYQELMLQSNGAAEPAKENVKRTLELQAEIAREVESLPESFRTKPIVEITKAVQYVVPRVTQRYLEDLQNRIHQSFVELVTRIQEMKPGDPLSFIPDINAEIGRVANPFNGELNFLEDQSIYQKAIGTALPALEKQIETALSKYVATRAALTQKGFQTVLGTPPAPKVEAVRPPPAPVQVPTEKVIQPEPKPAAPPEVAEPETGGFLARIGGIVSSFFTKSGKQPVSTKPGPSRGPLNVEELEQKIVESTLSPNPLVTMNPLNDLAAQQWNVAFLTQPLTVGEKVNLAQQSGVAAYSLQVAPTVLDEIVNSQEGFVLQLFLSQGTQPSEDQTIPVAVDIDADAKVFVLPTLSGRFQFIDSTLQLDERNITIDVRNEKTGDKQTIQFDLEATPAQQVEWAAVPPDFYQSLSARLQISGPVVTEIGFLNTEPVLLQANANPSPTLFDEIKDSQGGFTLQLFLNPSQDQTTPVAIDAFGNVFILPTLTGPFKFNAATLQVNGKIITIDVVDQNTGASQTILFDLGGIPSQQGLTAFDVVPLPGLPIDFLGGASSGGAGEFGGSALVVESAVRGLNPILDTGRPEFEETPHSEALMTAATVLDRRSYRAENISLQLQWRSLQTPEGRRLFQLRLIREVDGRAEAIDVPNFDVPESFRGGEIDQEARVQYGENLFVFTFRGDDGQTWVIVYDSQTGRVSTVSGRGEIPIRLGMDPQGRPILRVGDASLPIQGRPEQGERREGKEEEARAHSLAVEAVVSALEGTETLSPEVLSALFAMGLTVNPIAESLLEEMEKAKRKKPEDRPEVRMMGPKMTRREFLQMSAAGSVGAVAANQAAGQAAQPAGGVNPIRTDALDRAEAMRIVGEFNAGMEEASRRLEYTLLARDRVQFSDALEIRYRREMLIARERRLTRDVIVHETTTRVDLRPLVQRFVEALGISTTGDHTFTVDDWIENFFLPLFRMFGIPQGTPQRTDPKEAGLIERFTRYASELKPWLQGLNIQKDGDVSRFWRGDFMSVLGGRVRDNRGQVSRASDTDLWVMLNEAWPPQNRIANVDLGTFLGTVLFFTMVAESRRWIPLSWAPRRQDGQGYWEEANLRRMFEMSLNSNPNLRASAMEIERFHDRYGDAYFNIFFYPLPDQETAFLQELLTEEFAAMLRHVYPNLRVAPARELVGPRVLAATTIIPTLAALQSTSLWPEGRNIRYFLSGNQRSEQPSRRAFREMMQRVSRTLVGIRPDVENLYDGYDPPLVDEIFRRWLAGEYRHPADGQPQRIRHVDTADILRIDHTRMPEDFVFTRAMAEYIQRAAPGDRDLNRMTREAVMSVVGMRFGKMLNWGLYGLKKGFITFQDQAGQPPQTDVVPLRTLLRDMRRLLFASEYLFHRGTRRFNLNGNTDSGILAGMRNNMVKSGMSTETFKFLIALSGSQEIQEEALRLQGAMTGNPIWNPRPANLLNSMIMGAINGWATTRFLDGLHQTRGLADQIAGLYNDLTVTRVPRNGQEVGFTHKQAFYDWAVRLRRVWRPNAPGFTPEFLAANPPPDEDVFSYLTAEALALLDSGESFRNWLQVRESTIARLERRGQGQVDPIRDAFYVYQALRGRSFTVPARFEEDFREFERNLVDRPLDQGFVIIWAQNLVERRTPINRPWGHQVAQSLVNEGLRNIVRNANAHWQGFGRGMGARLPLIRVQNILEQHRTSQARLMIFAQSGVQQGWTDWLRTSRGMINYFDAAVRRVPDNPAQRWPDAFRLALNLHRGIVGAGVPLPEMNVENVLTKRLAQAIFLSYVEDFVNRQRSEVRALAVENLLESKEVLRQAVDEYFQAFQELYGNLVSYVKEDGLYNAELVASYRPYFDPAYAEAQDKALKLGLKHNEALGYTQAGFEPPQDDKEWAKRVRRGLEKHFEDLKRTRDVLADLFEKNPVRDASLKDQNRAEYLRLDLDRKIQLTERKLTEIGSDLDRGLLRKAVESLKAERGALQEILREPQRIQREERKLKRLEEQAALKEKLVKPVTTPQAFVPGTGSSSAFKILLAFAAAVLFAIGLGFVLPQGSRGQGEKPAVGQKQVLDIPQGKKEDRDFEAEMRRLLQKAFEEAPGVPLLDLQLIAFKAMAQDKKPPVAVNQLPDPKQAPGPVQDIEAEQLIKVLADEKKREELILDSFYLERGLANQPVDLKDAKIKAAFEQYKKDIPNSPTTQGFMKRWGMARLESGWDETTGLARRISLALTEQKDRREEILKEAQQLADFRFGKDVLDVKGRLDEDPTAKGLVIGWTQFRTSFYKDLDKSWRKTAGIAEESVKILNAISQDKKYGPEFYRHMAELFFFDTGLTPEVAKKQAKAQGATQLDFFKQTKERWNFVTGYVQASLLDFREAQARRMTPLPDAEKFTKHTQNLLHVLTDGDFRKELKKYYEGILLGAQPLDPAVRSKNERRQIWAEYAIRLRMIEKSHRTYDLTPQQITQTMKELVNVQRAGKEKWRKDQGLQDAESFYYHALTHTIFVREEIAKREALIEIPYTQMKDPFGKNFTADEFFELVAFVQQIRQKSAHGDPAVRPLKDGIFNMEEGILKSLEEFRTGAKKKPIWLTDADLEGLRDYVTGNKDKGILGLANEKMTPGEAIQEVTYYLDEQLTKKGEWPGLDRAKEEILRAARLEMFLQAAYMLHHKSEAEEPRRLGLADISAWRELVFKNRFRAVDAAGYIRDDGAFENLEKELRKKIKLEFGEKAARELPLFDPWGRLGFVTRMGLVIRLHLLGLNTQESLKNWFDDVYSIQAASYRHTGQFVDTFSIGYLVERFREGKSTLDTFTQGRVEAFFRSVAREDINFADLTPPQGQAHLEEGNTRRRFILTWQNIYRRLPTQEEVKEGLEAWKSLDKQPYLKAHPENVRIAVQKELIARIKSAEDALLKMVGPQVYDAKSAESLRQQLEPAFKKLRQAVVNSLIYLEDRLPQRLIIQDKIRSAKYQEVQALSGLKEKIDEQRKKGQIPQGKTPEAAIDEILKQKGYPIEILESGELKNFVREITSRGYSPEEFYLRFIDLENQVAKIYREVHKMPKIENPRRTLEDHQNDFISALAERIFSDWGFTRDEDKKAVQASPLKMTVEEGREKELKQLEGVLKDGIRIREILKGLGIDVTEEKAYQMADNSRNSAVQIREIENWAKLSEDVRKIVSEIKIHGKTPQLSPHQILFTADARLAIGLSLQPVIPEAPREEIEKMASDELTRVGVKGSQKEIVQRAIVRRIMERKLQPVQIRFLMDEALQMKAMVEESRLEEEKKDWFSDRTHAPRGLYDLLQKLELTDYLVLADLNMPAVDQLELINQKEFEEELGYNQKSFEETTLRPVNVMFKNLLEERLRRDIDPAIWLKNTHWFERYRWSWRYPQALETLSNTQIRIAQRLESWGIQGNVSLGFWMALGAALIFLAVNVLKSLLTRPWSKEAPLIPDYLPVVRDLLNDLKQAHQQGDMARGKDIELRIQLIRDNERRRREEAIHELENELVPLRQRLEQLREQKQVETERQEKEKPLGELKDELAALRRNLEQLGQQRQTETQKDKIKEIEQRIKDDSQMKAKILPKIWSIEDKFNKINQRIKDNAQMITEIEQKIRSIRFDMERDWTILKHLADLEQAHQQGQMDQVDEIRKRIDQFLEDKGRDIENKKTYVSSEKKIVWTRILPYNTFVFFTIAFATAIGVLTFNFSFLDPFALMVYASQFFWLVAVIKDVYLGKALVFAASLPFQNFFGHHVKPPLEMRDTEDGKNGISDEKSFVSINPLRPANDQQLRNVIRKEIQMLQAIRSKNVISILILQAAGNSTLTYERYEKILRDELFDKEGVDPDVKNRFIVFQMGEVAKIHNVYKAPMRWFFMGSEDSDFVTRNFIFGVDTSKKLSEIKTRSGKGREGKGATLKYVGGDLNYGGIAGQGSRAGILATPAGLENLKRLRNEDNPGFPLLENFKILDADNYTDPVTDLQMINTMTDDFSVWQPKIQYYNAKQSAHAYTKDFMNLNLGNIAQGGTTLVMGGVRSFGKYYGRFKVYYKEEVGGKSKETAGEEFPWLWKATTFALIGWALALVFAEPMSFLMHIVPFAMLAATIILTKSFGPRKVLEFSSRYQSMFPLGRRYIQSEDAFHGVFHRVAYLMDPGIHIYENTPASAQDDDKRWFNKWGPLFDMRNTVIFHTPIVAILSHPKAATIIAAALTTVSLGGFVLAILMSISPILTLLLGGTTVFFSVMTSLINGIRKSATPENIEKVKQSRFPHIPLRGEYAESHVVRSLLTDGIWLSMLALTVYAMMNAGLLETAFPTLGEFLFLGIMGLLLHPKFLGPLFTRISSVINPAYVGRWEMDPNGQIRYVIEREPGLTGWRDLLRVSFWKSLLRHLGGWLIHDVGVAAYEFVYTTSAYLLHLPIVPFEAIWWFYGVEKELKGMTAGVPTPGTWPSFLESEETQPPQSFFVKYRLPLVIGLAGMMLVVPSFPPLMALWGGAIVFSQWGLIGLGLASGLALGVLPAITESTLLSRMRGPKIEQAMREDKPLPDFTHAEEKRVLAIIGSIMIAGGMPLLGIFALPLQGFLPADLIIRASTILLGSFIFGPANAWFNGIMRGEVNPATSPPTLQPTAKKGDPARTRILVAMMGWGFIGVAIATTFFLNVPLSGLPVIGGHFPSGDGMAPTILPVGLTYGEMLRTPPTFAFFFNAIVFNTALMGILAYAIGIYSWIRGIRTKEPIERFNDWYGARGRGETSPADVRGKVDELIEQYQLLPRYGQRALTERENQIIREILEDRVQNLTQALAGAQAELQDAQKFTPQELSNLQDGVSQAQQIVDLLQSEIQKANDELKKFLEFLSSPAPPPAAPRGPLMSRRRKFLTLAIGAVLSASAGGLYWYFTKKREEDQNRLDLEMPLGEYRNQLHHSQLEYFKEGRGLVRGNYMRGDDLREILIPVDRIGADGRAFVPGTRDTRYTQPLVLGFWLNILTQQTRGTLPATVANPLDELERFVDFLSYMQEEYRVPVWMQIRPDIVLDPRRATGIEDIDGYVAQLVLTTGALIRMRDQERDQARRQRISNLIATLGRLVEANRQVFTTLYDPQRGLLAGDYDVRRHQAVLGRHKDRRTVEDRAALALLISLYGLPDSAWTNAPFNLANYTNRQGRTFPVIQAYDGGAFQHGFNFLLGLESRYPHLRLLHDNAAEMFLDHFERSGGQSYFPGAVFVGPENYQGRVGVRAGAENPAATENVVVPAYALPFARERDDIIEHLRTNLTQLGIRNRDLEGLLFESVVNQRPTQEHTAVVVGSGILGLIDAREDMEAFIRAVQANAVANLQAVPNLQARIDRLYSPAVLGIQGRALTPARPQRAEVRAETLDIFSFVPARLLRLAHERQLSPEESDQVQQEIHQGITDYYRALGERDAFRGVREMIQNPFRYRKFGEVIVAFKEAGVYGGESDWRARVPIKGTAWKITQEGRRTFTTFEEHHEAILKAAKALAERDYESLAKRFDPKSFPGGKVDLELIRPDLEAARALWFDSLAPREKALLETALVYHDNGRIVTTGPTHPAVGGELVPSLSRAVEAFDHQERALLQSLTDRELDIGSLHFGEATPTRFLRKLSERGVDLDLFLRMAWPIFIFDAGSVPRGSLEEMGRLTPTHLKNAVFLSNSKNMKRLADEWHLKRWEAFFLPNQEVLDLSRHVGGNAAIPPSFIEFARGHRGFARNITLQRTIFPFRRMAQRNPDNLLKFLKLATTLYEVPPAQRQVSFLGFSTDRWGHTRKLAGTLSRLPESSRMEKQGFHFDLKQNPKNPNIGTLTIRDEKQIRYATADVRFTGAHENEIVVETWKDLTRRAEARRHQEEERLLEALQAKTEFERTQQLYQQIAQLMDLTHEAEGLGIHLENELMNLSNWISATKLAIPVRGSSAADKGAIILEWKTDYAADHFSFVLEQMKRAPRVNLVAQVGEGESLEDALKAVFGQEVFDQNRLVVHEIDYAKQSLEQLVLSEAKELGVRAEDTVQVITDLASREVLDSEVLKSALLGAAALAQGRIVVVSDQKLGLPGIQSFTIAQLVSTLVESVRATREMSIAA